MYVFFFILIINTACTPREMIANSTNDLTQPIINQTAALDASQVPVETFGPDCLGSDTHPIDQEIANQFKDASYEEVMI
jgi:hypothetical protein